MIEIVLTLCIVLVWLFVIGHVVALGLAWKRLSSEHPAVWSSLGRPSIFNINPSVVLPSKRYLYSSECRSLGDKKLQTLCAWSKSLGLVGAGLFLVFAVSILVVVMSP